MIKVNVVLDYPSWKKKIKFPESYLKKKLNKLSKVYPFKNKSKEFSILLTNNKMMKDLNRKFRKKNKPTDVLSFPFKKSKSYHGHSFKKRGLIFFNFLFLFFDYFTNF